MITEQKIKDLIKDEIVCYIANNQTHWRVTGSGCVGANDWCRPAEGYIFFVIESYDLSLDNEKITNYNCRVVEPISIQQYNPAYEEWEKKPLIERMFTKRPDMYHWVDYPEFSCSLRFGNDMEKSVSITTYTKNKYIEFKKNENNQS